MPNESPIVLINPNTGGAEQYAPQDAQGLLQQGYHVPLNDAEGNPVSASYEEAQQLVGRGSHSQPHPEQLKHLLDTAHYGSAKQQALSFIEGALEPNTFGAYGRIASETGLTTSEDIQKRQEFNPGTHALGEAAGIIGGVALAPETSIPGLISKAGNAARAGIAAEGFFGKAAQLATQSAIEGGLFTAEHEVSEKLLGDPNVTGESMLGNIGMGAALGGGLGIALSPIAVAAEKALGLGRGYLGRTQTAKDLVEKGASIPDVLPHMGLNEAERGSVLKGLSELKPNAKEIQEAAAAINAPVLESQISSSKFVQDLDSNLMQSPTMSGIKRQQIANEGYKASENAINEALGQNLGMSKAEAGEAIKKGLSDALTEESAPITDIYNKVREIGQTVPVEASALKAAAKDMAKIDGLLSSKGDPISKSSPGYKLAKRVEGELSNLATVDDVRLYAQRIGQDTIGQPELKYVAGQIQSKLNALIEDSTLNFAKKTLPDAEALIEQHQLAKKAYGALRDEIDELGGALGKKLRKGEGPQAFIDFLNESTPEKIADKLFTKNNSRFLEFLQKRFPEQSDLLSSLKKSQIKDAALADGQLNPNKVLKEIDKLEPEIKKFLFKPEELDKIKATQTYLDAMPKNVNPSGTSKGMQLFDFLRHPISGSISQGSDFLKTKLIQQLVKSSPGEAPLINALIHMADMSGKMARGIEKHAGGIFGKATETLIESNNDKKSYPKASEPLKMDKIGNVIEAYMANPEGLIDHMTRGLTPINDHAPTIANSMTTSVGTAVTFLASKMPSKDRLAPLDTPNTPNNVEVAKFNRYVEIVNQPLKALQYVKNGSILPQDIEAISQVYPSLYNNMKQAVTEKLVNYTSTKNVSELPYKTKLGLSMFLGQNLDSTLSAQNILQSQAILGGNQMQTDMNQMGQTKPSKVGISKMHTFDSTKAEQSMNRHSDMRSV